jgi:hypothetical protein
MATHGSSTKKTLTNCMQRCLTRCLCSWQAAVIIIMLPIKP